MNTCRCRGRRAIAPSSITITAGDEIMSTHNGDGPSFFGAWLMTTTAMACRTSAAASCRAGDGGVAVPVASRQFCVPWLVLLSVLLVLVPPTPSSALTTDGVLLLAFKYAVLDDPMSVLASWNYADDTPCGWNGVSCAGVPSDGNGPANNTSRVVSLVLPNARLLGSVPPDLGLIPHLRHLDLSGNSLNGSLPYTLFFPNASASPSELRVLSLANNEISGELPDIPTSGTLTNLEELNLSDNALTGRIPLGLALLPNLTVLSLSGNYLSGSLPVSSSSVFPIAAYVDLSSNLLNGTLSPDFGDNGTIRYLNLSFNRFGGEIPAGFAAKFPRNAVIDLSFNNLTGTIPDSEVLRNQKPRAFSGNSDLCGQPLKILCPISSTSIDTSSNATSSEAENPPGGGNSPPAFAAMPKTVEATAPGGDGSQRQTEQRGLKPAAIVGIIAGDLGGIGLLFLVFLYLYHGKKKKRQLEDEQQRIQPHDASRGIEAGKVTYLGTSKQQHWITKSSTVSTSETTGHASGGLSSVCFGRKASAAGDESETSSGSDTEPDDTEGKVGGDAKLQKDPQKQSREPQQSGVLVTVDGESELELETLLKASAYILGATGSSIVYKAVLDDGTVLAVRRIGENGRAADKLRDFEAQVRSVAKLRHPNLLGIRGFYWGAEEKLLIYDYAPNGSLANISYKKLGSSPYHLSWESRLRIAKGVARGLAYLHEKKCVHGNIKPSNILLGHDMDAMIGDFGIERLTSADGSSKHGFSARHFGSKRSTVSQSSLPETSPTAMGVNASPCASCGGSSSASPYHAPESLKNLKPCTKWDIYAFGVIVLELLTGRVFSEAELSQWTAGIPAEETNRVLRMTDPAIRGELEGREEVLLSCFRVGFSCASVAPQKRPSMKEASQVLDRLPSLEFSPSQPGWPDH